MRPFRLLTFLVVGLACVALTAKKPRRVYRESDLRPVLLRPAVARTLSKPFLPLLIDVYWLRVLNAIGDTDSTRKNRALYDYGRVLTDLDPRFLEAYVYLGVNIPFQEERNVWANAELASDLLRRGLTRFPDNAKLHLFLGFTLFQMERKYVEAAEVFASLAKLPDSPPWAALLATRLLSHGGEAKEGLALARELLASTPDEETRAELEQRVLDMEVEATLQSVDDAVASFTQRFGVAPPSLEELISQGVYSGPRVDARGGSISIGANGKATTTSLERRLSLYEQQ